MRYNGTQWINNSPRTFSEFMSVWGSSGDNVYVAGASTLIFNGRIN
jgi:hypothetical protein